MAVAQAEFVAFKAEAAEKMKKVEDVVTTTLEDTKKFQEATDLISIQAAPWSVFIETAVVASEAKAEFTLTEVRSIYEGTNAKVEDLRRRATEVEKKTWHRHLTPRNGRCRGQRIWNCSALEPKKSSGPDSESS